jgi:hypothetical protein
VRFENLPPEWHRDIPYVLEWRDPRGLSLTLPPSNRIGWPSGCYSTRIDDNGRAEPLPAPEAGQYTLSLVPPDRDDVPAWLTREVTIPEGAPPALVLRIPDGARVTLIAQGEPGRLAIGPAEAGPWEEGRVVFPRVPAGRHEIWRLDRFGSVRVGEIDVPAHGEIRHELKPLGTARLEAEFEWSPKPDAVELRRDADGQVMARDPHGGRVRFERLDPGNYTLVAGEHRITVVLADGEKLDLGAIR